MRLRQSLIPPKSSPKAPPLQNEGICPIPQNMRIGWVGRGISTKSSCPVSKAKHSWQQGVGETSLAGPKSNGAHGIVAAQRVSEKKCSRGRRNLATTDSRVVSRFNCHRIVLLHDPGEGQSHFIMYSTVKETTGRELVNQSSLTKINTVLVSEGGAL